MLAGVPHEPDRIGTFVNSMAQPSRIYRLSGFVARTNDKNPLLANTQRGKF
jgi:hypothetical protein